MPSQEGQSSCFCQGILSALNVICKFSGTAIPGLGKASWKPPWCWPTPHLGADPVQCCCLTQASASPFLPNENPGVPGSLSWHIIVPPARALALDRLPPLSRAKGVILGASLPLSFTFEDGDKAGGSLVFISAAAVSQPCMCSPEFVSLRKELNFSVSSVAH